MAVVLVTGGSSGIGLVTVWRLGAGHRVFAASRNPARAPVPDDVTPLVLDVGDAEGADAAVASLVEAAGRLDVLVRTTTPDDFAGLLRAFVDGLASPGDQPPPA